MTFCAIATTTATAMTTAVSTTKIKQNDNNYNNKYRKIIITTV